ncbi:hypothetical protein D3C84_1124500 [compost metagenome]
MHDSGAYKGWIHGYQHGERIMHRTFAKILILFQIKMEVSLKRTMQKIHNRLLVSRCQAAQLIEMAARQSRLKRHVQTYNSKRQRRTEYLLCRLRIPP